MIVLSVINEQNEKVKVGRRFIENLQIKKNTKKARIVFIIEKSNVLHNFFSLVAP